TGSPSTSVTGTGSGPTGVGSGSSTTTGESTTTTGMGGGSSASTGMGGNVTSGGGGGGAGGAGGMMTGAGGAGGMPMPDAGTGGKTGRFRILVLSTTLEFHHDSIPAGLQMLKDLGNLPDSEFTKIGASPGGWDVDSAGADPASPTYFSEFTDANLAKYEMVYSDNPTGQVFTLAPNSAMHEMAFQNFMANGGAWAGQHSATDFENQSKFTWFQTNVDGAWFTQHDNDGTNGTIQWESTQAQHPILKGIPSPWNATDEWYKMSKDISAVPGFTVLGKVTVPNSTVDPNARPAVWIRDPPTGGRSFYTIRGHNIRVYAEPAFRQLMFQGILWATHRLK
ncbi:MAG TPA: ThuA domain-containing protein, partial [Chloroflexota bacterium]|nr:ThuA domain-containing protein [Chloroflexota bacterium]